MDESLKKIKKMLLEYTTTKIFPHELNDIEATTLSEIHKEIKKKNDDDSDIKPMVDYLINNKYFKDDSGSYYSFEAYNNKMIHFNKIEITKYDDYDEDEDEDKAWYHQKNVLYNEECRNYISSERILDNYRDLKPISAEEYQVVYFKIKQFKEIKRRIVEKENKVNEQIKRVKFLGTSLRLCDYTKDMTREEYIKLANLIDEETRKDVIEYLNYLNEKYRGKYIYIRNRENLHLYKVNRFELVNQIINVYSSETYSINPVCVSKTFCDENCEHVELIIDIVDENIIKEIDNLIEDFYK